MVVTSTGVPMRDGGAVVAGEEVMMDAPLVIPRDSLGLPVTAGEEPADVGPGEGVMTALELDRIVPDEIVDHVAPEAEIGMGVKGTESKNDWTGEKDGRITPEEGGVSGDTRTVPDKGAGYVGRPVLAVAGGSEGLPDTDVPTGVIVPSGPGTRLVLL